MSNLPEYAVREIIQDAMNAASFAYDQIKIAGMDAANEYARPSVVYRPALSLDGDSWCALYGENIQEGVAAYGDSPGAAMYAFDLAWWAKSPAKGAP